jgi:uncharacterized protein (DUF433 family)
MSRQPAAYKRYRWIVADPEWLGGKPALRNTRLSVTLVLECLSAGMSASDINEAFAVRLTDEALSETIQVGAEFAAA